MGPHTLRGSIIEEFNREIGLKLGVGLLLRSLIEKIGLKLGVGGSLSHGYDFDLGFCHEGYGGGREDEASGGGGGGVGGGGGGDDA